MLCGNFEWMFFLLFFSHLCYMWLPSDPYSVHPSNYRRPTQHSETARWNAISVCASAFAIKGHLAAKHRCVMVCGFCDFHWVYFFQSYFALIDIVPRCCSRVRNLVPQKCDLGGYAADAVSKAVWFCAFGRVLCGVTIIRNELQLISLKGIAV